MQLFKKILLYFFISCTTYTIAQDIVLELPIEEKFKFGYTSIVPNNTSNLGLFFFGLKASKGILLNESMEAVSTFDFDGIPFNYQYRLEHIADDYKFLFLFKDRFDKKIAIAKYDLTDGQAEFKEDLIVLKKEIYLQSFVDSQTPYILTINKNSSVLNLYSFNIEGDFDKNTVDLSTVKFRHWNNDIVTLAKLIEKPFGSDVDNLMSKIDATKPTSLEDTANASKLFLEENTIHLIFKSNRNISQSVTIDLNDLSYHTNIFNKPFIPKSEIERRKRSNSFVLNNTYFGISGTSQILKLEIKDLESKKVINSFQIERNKRLPFENAPIYFEGTGLKNRSGVIEDTNKFLSGISSNEIGISAFKNDDDFVLTFGTFKEGTAGFGIGFGGISFQISALYSYSTTKSTFVKGQFDSKFNYLEEMVPKTKYDLVKDFINQNGKGKKEIIKKVNNSYLYGTLDRKNSKYIIHKF